MLEKKRLVQPPEALRYSERVRSYNKIIIKRKFCPIYYEPTDGRRDGTLYWLSVRSVGAGEARTGNSPQVSTALYSSPKLVEAYSNLPLHSSLTVVPTLPQHPQHQTQQRHNKIRIRTVLTGLRRGGEWETQQFIPVTGSKQQAARSKQQQHTRNNKKTNKKASLRGGSEWEERFPQCRPLVLPAHRHAEEGREVVAGCSRAYGHSRRTREAHNVRGHRLVVGVDP